MERLVHIGFDMSMYHFDGSYNGKRPIKNEIYTPVNYEEREGIRCVELAEIPGYSWPIDGFRPISDCGPAICEWIEETAFKEYQLEEAIKQ
ncbi:MAG TPA: hypothetical protein PKN99_11095 [Cyclobacteriaceae bacterium]|nr:hypothetical protein [Cyclobacteriaceae bacterium]